MRFFALCGTIHNADSDIHGAMSRLAQNKARDVLSKPYHHALDEDRDDAQARRRTAAITVEVIADRDPYQAPIHVFAQLLAR